MATQLGRMVIQLDSFLPIKSYGPIITWSCKIMWQNKTIISPLPRCLWPPILPGWRLALRGFYHIITWPLIRWSCWIKRKFKIYISTFTRLMATKIGRVITSLGTKISTQTLKLVPTSCFVFLCLHVTQNTLQLSFYYSFFFSFWSVFLDGQTKVIFIFFSNCCFKCVSLGSELLMWYVVCFQAMSFRDKQQERLESSSSTTKNFISPLPQRPWLISLAQWWLTMRGSHP